MRSWKDRYVIYMIRKRLRKHGYSETVVNRVITMYTQPKPYKNV